MRETAQRHSKPPAILMIFGFCSMYLNSAFNGEPARALARSDKWCERSMACPRFSMVGSDVESEITDEGRVHGEAED